MEDALKDIPIKNIDMPEGISFVRINKDTGLIDANSKDSYFELILSEKHIKLILKRVIDKSSHIFSNI